MTRISAVSIVRSAWRWFGLGWDDWLPWGGDDLPRTGEDLGTLDGSPAELKAAAGSLRSVADGLMVAWNAVAELGAVVGSQSWKGDAYAKFHEKMAKAPSTGDIDNAQGAVRKAAETLDTLAGAVQARQGELAVQKTALDGLGLAGDGDIEGAKKDRVKQIVEDTKDIRDRYKSDLRTAQTVFDQLDDAPRYAKDHSGWNYWLKAGLHNVGDFFEGAWEGIWDSLTALTSLSATLVQPWKWPEAFTTAKQVVSYAIENPVEFGKLLIDVEGFKKNPAKWLGNLAPSVVAAIFTAGAGGVALRVASTSPRILRLTKKLDAAKDGDGKPDGSDPSDTDPDFDPKEIRRLDAKIEEVMAVVRGINPSGDMSNCPRCVIALEMALRAKSRGLSNVPNITVRPGHPDYNRKEVAKLLGSEFTPVRKFSDIEKLVLDGGPGTRGIIAGTYPRAPGADPSKPLTGHLFNVINVDGHIVYLDAQSGRMASAQYRLDAKSFQYMPIPKEHQ